MRILIQIKLILSGLINVGFEIWEYGGNCGKFIASFLIASVFYPFFTLFEKYVFNDWEFFGFWAVAITADLFTGIWKHIKKNDFCSKTMLVKLMEKISLSFFALTLFKGIAWMLNAEDGGTIQVYWTFIGRSIVFCYVGISAFENMYEITGGKFPPVGWMTKLKKFNETGKVEDLTKETA